MKKPHIHPQQAFILRKLTQTDTERYLRLKPQEITSDHFNFHIKKLVEQGYVEKTEQGEYQLTIEGKTFASRLNEHGATILQPKSSVLVMAYVEEKGEKLFVIEKRDKHPFLDHFVFPTTRIRWGESVHSTAEELLLHSTHAQAPATHIGSVRRLDYSENEENIYNDILFHVLSCDLTKLKQNLQLEASMQLLTKQEFLAQEKLTQLPSVLFPLFEGAAPAFQELLVSSKESSY